MIGYARKFEVEFISLLIKDVKNDKYMINDKYNDKCIKTKVKSYNGKITTGFDGSKMPKDGSHGIGLSIILILFLKWVNTIIQNHF